jgi:transposase-like protein
VPRPTYPRTVPEFNRFFPDEQACLAYLAACRWPDGFRCPRCGHDEAFVLPRRRLWQCKSCAYQVSVTAGTILHRTRTSLLTWFWAAYWMTAHKQWPTSSARPSLTSPVGELRVENPIAPG